MVLDGEIETIDVRERSTRPITRRQFEKLEASDAFWRLAEAGIVSLVRSRDTPFGVRATNYVGDVLIDRGLRLRVTEKIEGALRSLLQSSLPDDLTLIKTSSSIAATGEFLTLFAAKFVESLGPYLRRGRKKGYVPQREISSFPRGKIHVASTAKLRARGIIASLAQVRSTLTAAIYENQLLSAAVANAEAVISNNPSYSETLTSLRLLAPLFSDVSSPRIMHQRGSETARQFELALRNNSSFPELKTALQFARLLVLHSGIWSEEVQGEVPESYFLNLESLFEEAVRESLEVIMRQRSQIVIAGTSLNAPLFPSNLDKYNADPDIVIKTAAGVTAAIADCKYKELGSGPAHHDVYQIVAHCSAFHTNLAILIYPDARPSCEKLGTTAAGVLLWYASVRPTCLQNDLQECLKKIGLNSETASYYS